MSGLGDVLDGNVRALRERLPAGAAPTVGLVLGSGLGDYAERIDDRLVIPYRDLPGFPVSTVEGHAGNLVYGRRSGVEVLVMQGRVHYYEGHDLPTVVMPARTLVRAGCRTLVITNAAGGVNLGFSPGDLVIISDHLNLFGVNPLYGPNDDGVGPRFPDMTTTYSPELRAIAVEAGRAVGLELREGVYAASSGPSYETPAEVRMLRTLGADLVGMSSVPEAIAARHMQARVLGISCVSNMAAGVTGAPLTHQEVKETAERVRPLFMALLDEILTRVGGGSSAR